MYRPTARVLTVLELLQTYGQLSGAELANRLEVDVRTVRRYIATLQDMGIPVESETGRAGGYVLRPGFKLPPLMFTQDEVLMLTLGLRMARRSGLADAVVTVESALAKIDRVLPLELRERALALQSAMQMEDDAAESEVASHIVTMLTLGSQQHRQILLRYALRDRVTERIIDPYGVVCYQGRWYTVGYCHLREDQRVFRLDRVRSVDMLDSTFTPPPNFDALAAMLESFEAIPDQWNIEVLVEMPLDEARQRIPRGLATITEDGQGVRLRASIPDLNEMARTLIALNCPLTIISPLELRQAFRLIAQELLDIALHGENE